MRSGLALDIIDDFDDGQDDSWTRVDVIGGLTAPPATFSFPNGGYRFEAPNPAVPDAGQARALSYRGDASYTDFYAAVDIVAWDDSLDQGLGLGVRLNNVALGQTTGFIIMYYANPSTSAPYAEFEIDRISGEALETTLAVTHVRWDPQRSYRLVAIGEGGTLKAYLYDREDLTRPLSELVAENALDSTPGHCGLVTFYRGNDLTGAQSRTDATFDNFWALSGTPTSVTPPAAPHGVVGAPQVLDRIPPSQANFHEVAQGLHFRATTLSGGEIPVETIQLLLNGTDHSEDLVVSGPPDDREVSFPGLEANQIYSAEIHLTSGTGLQTVNRFTFDTLVEADLPGEAFLVIESEDYDFGERECDYMNGTIPASGGQFIDRPALTNVDEGGQVLPEGAIGYGGVVGLRGVDYFDYENFLEWGDDESLYRICDGPGVRFSADTRRQTYQEAGLREQESYRTEAGEWLNYTRTWPAGKKQVFLRTACQWEQTVRVDRVSANQSLTPLGRFLIPNTVAEDQSRFVPLVDMEGAPLTVEWEGVNTLRLTVEGEPREFSRKWNLFMNYLLVLPGDDSPVLPDHILISDPQINGTVFSFTFETVNGVVYRPEYKTNLGEATWTALPTMEGDGNPAQIEDEITGQSRIYRVRTE